MPLKTGIDARVVGRRGVGRYLASLVSAMARAYKTSQFVLFTGPRSDLSTVPKEKNIVISQLPPGHAAWVEQRLLPLEARQQHCDLLHFPDNTGALWPGMPTVLTLHDTMWTRPLSQAVAKPTLNMRLQDYYRKSVCPRAAAAATRVITISRDSLIKIETALDIDPGKICQVAEALPPLFEKKLPVSKVKKLLKNLNLQGSFVLASGAADRRKNVDRLVKAFAAASKIDSTIASARLVIASMRPGEEAATTYRQTARRLGIEHRLAYPGYVSDEEMKALYQGALCFAFPTLWEGFGIPVLEAFSMGCPVLTSNTSALPETAGQGALLVNPESEEEIAHGLAVLAKKSNASLYRGKGKKELKRFSWDKAARRTMQVYEEAVGSF